MSSIATSASTDASPTARLDVLFDELSELMGQRNAVDGRIVEIIAEIDHDELWGATGCRSVAALVAWKTGSSPGNAEAIAALAHRLEEFPRCAQGLTEGRLSLDQVGVIAQRGAPGSDAHYAQLAESATVSQLRTAIKLAPRPQPDPRPAPPPSITKTSRDPDVDVWRITLPHTESAVLEAALGSARDALIAEWTRDRNAAGDTAGQQPPMPTNIDAFLRLVTTGWDADVAARPHGQRTTVVVHLDVDQRIAALHLGPLLSDAERQYLTCDATCEAWFERQGQVIGCGRAARTINRRLRRALEHRYPSCAVPGCGATRGLHGHHIRHWEDGGVTELINLVLVCPYHHRLHHRGIITISGDAEHLVVSDRDGHPLQPGSLARPPANPPPAVPPYPGPTGEHADWWWYDPFQPQPPPNTN